MRLAQRSANDRRSELHELARGWLERDPEAWRYAPVEPDFDPARGAALDELPAGDAESWAAHWRTVDP